MTCIVGVQKGKTVWIGADSAGTAGDMTQRIRADKKVFVNGEFIIGFTGSFRTGQLLRHKLVPPEHPDGKSDTDFLVTDFVDAVKACLKDEEGGDAQPWFLFGYRGRLYQMEGDFQVAEPAGGFEAMGSGGEVAVGVLRATQKMRNARKRCLMALEASAENNAAVRPPFHVLSLRRGARGK